MTTPNFVLLTFDSCRFDVLREADTPVIDSFAEIIAAQTPANFTLAAHQAFFAGLLPNAIDDIPYYNRFRKQLLGIAEVGETNVVKEALVRVVSDGNLVTGLQDQGYQTVGAGAMNWFRQSTLREGFAKFLYTGTDAEAQIAFVLASLDMRRPFFAFINFGETHAPYTFRGKADECPIDVRARRMRWPPIEEGPVGRENEAFGHQMRAAEYLDRMLPRLLSALPGHTIVVLCADHGDCFGEDGYWGHGVNHAKVLEVPLSIFSLDGSAI